MKSLGFALVFTALAACGSETTSFRTTDKSDPEHSPTAATYDVRRGDQLVAQVYVSSSGGYIGNSEEPMTHVGFEIRNASRGPIVFDSEALALVLFDNKGATLPAPSFTAITPLGPSQVPIAAATTVTLDGYFKIPVRPRVVAGMRIQWSLRMGDERYLQTTSFTRDDDQPVIDYRRPPESGTTVHAGS